MGYADKIYNTIHIDIENMLKEIGDLEFKKYGCL